MKKSHIVAGICGIGFVGLFSIFQNTVSYNPVTYRPGGTPCIENLSLYPYSLDDLKFGLLVGTTSLNACKSITSMVNPSLSVEKHIYKVVDNKLQLPLYVLKKTTSIYAPRPALVLFHGGGWVGGSPYYSTDWARYFAERGFVSVIVNYRLLPNSQNVPLNKSIWDAQTAIRWVRKNAKNLGIDPKRIGVMGESAGGHLAAYTGIMEGNPIGVDPAEHQSLSDVSAKSNAMVLYNPVYKNSEGLLGYGRTKTPVLGDNSLEDNYLYYSPWHNVENSIELPPPAIVFVGTNDVAVSEKTVCDFHRKMKERGVPLVRTKIFPGGIHSFYNSSSPKYRTIYDIDLFFQHLGWIPKSIPTIQRPAIMDVYDVFFNGAVTENFAMRNCVSEDETLGSCAFKFGANKMDFAGSSYTEKECVKKCESYSLVTRMKHPKFDTDACIFKTDSDLRITRYQNHSF